MTTNKIYQTPETPLVFTESGGDSTFSTKNTADGHGRISNQLDRGAGAKPRRYLWEAQAKLQGNATLGLPVRVYMYSGGSTYCDISADADLSAESQLSNFALVGRILVSGTTSNAGPFYESGVINLLGRYVNVAVWNATGQTFTNSNGDTKITLTPIPDDIQAAS